MFIIGLLILFGVIVFAMGGWDNFVATLQRSTGGKSGAALGGSGNEPTPEDILRNRFARGELSHDEYLEAIETLTK